MTILITVLGIVQGVGFRPFVARLAKELAIKGTVINAGGVVIINANSNNENALDQFIYRLKNTQPEGANVIETRTQIIPDREFDGFDILESDKSFQESPLIPVDLPMCETCRRELYDPSNRRYLYPFISCVACGPRYSIIKELPYDRETITMNVFGMCKACEKEYKENTNRRCHAQTISCHDCGPQLKLVEYGNKNDNSNNKDNDNKSVSERINNNENIKYNEDINENINENIFKNMSDNEKHNNNETKRVKGKAVNKYTDNKITDCLISANIIYESKNALNRTIDLLVQGKVLAIKGIGGYQFVCLPSDKDAVDKLRLLKRRDKKPFAIMFPNMQSLRMICECCDDEEKLLLSTARPIVLLNKKNHTNSTNNANNTNILYDDDFNSKDRENKTLNTYFSLTSNDIRNSPSTNNLKHTEICHDVCGESQLIGAFLPYTPLHQLLTDACGPLVMTSGNITSEPIIISDAEMLVLLESPYLSGVLYNERQILTPLDDSIMRIIPNAYCQNEQVGGENENAGKTRKTGESILDSEETEDASNSSQKFINNPSMTKRRVFYQNLLSNTNNSNNTNTNSNNKQIIRRSRGFVPSPLILDKSTSVGILALGGDLKSCFCLYQNERAYLSQYFGDMENYKVLTAYKENIERMKNLFGIAPDIIACDLHPQYFTTLLANSFSTTGTSATGTDLLIQVQHHHAHAASVMAEHDLDSCIGVIFDGTGYGTDGAIWGGEFLLCKDKKFERRAHLGYVTLCGGDQVAKDSKLASQCYLHAASCCSICSNKKISEDEDAKSDFKANLEDEDVKADLEAKFDIDKNIYDIVNENTNSDDFNSNHLATENDSYDLDIVKAALEQHINTFESSSMGRLFDAVSAILDIKNENSFEGECAIALENSAKKQVLQETTTRYDLNLETESESESNNKKIFTNPLLEKIKFDIDYNSKEIIIDQVGLFDKIYNEFMGKSLDDQNSNNKCTISNNTNDYNSNSSNSNSSNSSSSSSSSSNNNSSSSSSSSSNNNSSNSSSSSSSINNSSNNNNNNSGNINNPNQNRQGLLAFAFHNAIVEMVIDVCIHLRIESGENKIALSGGVFANMLILKGCINGLENCGFQVFINNEVPTNDGGISLGQAWLCRKEFIQKKQNHK